MSRKIVLALIILLNISNLIMAADPPVIMPLFYDLDLTIDYENELLKGKCQLTVINKSTQPARMIPIQIYRLMQVTSIMDEREKPMDYIQTIRGYQGEPKLQVNYIQVTLPQPLEENQTLKLTIHYEGYLEGMTEVHGYVYDHINREFTIIRKETGAYPKVEYPSERLSKHILRQRFDYRLKVNVPNELTVANAGILVNKITKGDRNIFIYKSKLPSCNL